MLNIIFAHNHYFRMGTNFLLYSNGGLSYSVFEKFLRHFDNITVVGRDGGKFTEKSLFKTVASGPNVNFDLIPNLSNLKSIFFFDKKIRNRIENLVKDHHAVIVRLPSEVGLLLLDEAVRQGKPYAIEMVGCPYDAYTNYGSLKARLYAPYAAYRVRHAVRQAKFATYVTTSFLQKRYPCLDGVTANFSDVIIKEPSQQFLDSRLLRIKSHFGRIVIGIIGNYSAKYKGIDVAIKALALSKDSISPFELRVLGSGDTSILQKIAAQCGLEELLFFDNPRPAGDAVFDWLDNIDLYLQPSLTEGLPRALIEAMSRACPAVGTSVGGICELLPPDKLVAPGSASELSILLTRLLNDKSALLEAATANFNAAFDYTSTKLNAKQDRFWSLFSNFCASSKLI